MIRILLVGDFWNRQPLAYAAIRDRLSDRIEFVAEAGDAHLALFSHSHDLVTHGKTLAYHVAAHPRLRPVLLSEEPFWDSCWSADPFARYQTWTAGPAPFGYAVLNHATSDIFDTEKLPYFLLTDPRYLARYRPLFARNAGFSEANWLARWRNVTWDAAFVAERREESRHGPRFHDHEVWGLSPLRSAITLNCKGTKVLRSGRGWDVDTPRSQLANWHADKLARLDLKCRYVSALENTHQANYVSEKIFDAFAVGGVPLYIASKSHWVSRYVGAGSWINLEAHLPRPGAPRAPAFDAGSPVSADLAKAYVATQTRLAHLVASPAVIEEELDRLCQRLFAALNQLVPAPEGKKRSALAADAASA